MYLCVKWRQDKEMLAPITARRRFNDMVNSNYFERGVFIFCLHFSRRQQQQVKQKRDTKYHHLPEFYNV